MAYLQSRATYDRTGSTRRGRGSGRGHLRGGGAGSGPTFQRAEASLPRPDISQRQLRTIAPSSLGGIDNTTSKTRLAISNVAYVASYNWVDRDAETILIPGKPPKWQPPTGAVQQLQEDNGQYYRDPNSARYPQHPVEPALRAIYGLSDNFDSSAIDIFGCGSTLGSLLSFVRKEQRSFRFGVERIGNTLFLVRKTNTPKEVIEDVRGYGHTFPEAYTSWEPDVKGSASHQRMITYTFAGLRCLVRTECDGYIPATTTAASTRAVGGDDGSTSATDTNDGLALADMLSATAVGSAHRRSPAQLRSEKNLKLQLQRSSSENEDPVSQSSIFDLKTRSIKRKDNILQNMSTEFLHRLWINQTPNLILAWHDRGAFSSNNIQIKDVHDDVKVWEAKHGTLLRHYHRILTELMELSKATKRFEVRRTGTGDLEVWSEVDGWSALPKALKKRWKDGGKSDNELSEDEGVAIGAEAAGDNDDDYLRF